MGLWPINALTCNDFRLNLSFFGGSCHFIHLRPHVCNDICTNTHAHTQAETGSYTRTHTETCVSLRVLENKSAAETGQHNRVHSVDCRLWTVDTAQYAKAKLTLPSISQQATLANTLEIGESYYGATLHDLNSENS